MRPRGLGDETAAVIAAYLVLNQFVVATSAVNLNDGIVLPKRMDFVISSAAIYRYHLS